MVPGLARLEGMVHGPEATRSDPHSILQVIAGGAQAMAAVSAAICLPAANSRGRRQRRAGQPKTHEGQSGSDSGGGARNGALCGVLPRISRGRSCSHAAGCALVNDAFECIFLFAIFNSAAHMVAALISIITNWARSGQLALAQFYCYCSRS